jgi:hypothetical protein
MVMDDDKVNFIKNGTSFDGHPNEHGNVLV